MIWKVIKHFKHTEPWGTPARMSGVFLLTVDAIHGVWGPDTRIIIHCGFDIDGHTTGSRHYKGDAGDFHIVDGEPYPLQIAHMESVLRDLQVSDYVGLGIYPDWNHPGFHLDTRGEHARWGYVESLAGYIAYEAAKEYAVQKFSYPGEAPGKP